MSTLPAGVSRSGVYGLFRLDGAAVDPRDLDALGLPVPAAVGSAVAHGLDPQAPMAVSRSDSAGAITILVGELEEAGALADELALPRDTAPALLARAALDRFGPGTPARMLGEWSLLHWHGGRLTLASSAARRDRLLYSLSGTSVAVGPDMFRLAGLPWVGSALDEVALLMALGRGGLRQQRADRTMLARVKQVEPGAVVSIERDRCRKTIAPALAPQPPWTGTLDDALAEIEHVIRRVMRSRFERNSTPAILLSGGLDSSLLATLGAAERHQSDLLLITSAAPAGSGLRDETEYADAVAASLGLAIEHIAPPPELNIYRPSDEILGSAIGPPLPTRHCLTEAFQVAARRMGATLLVNGTYGEMTATAPLRLGSGGHWIRRVARHFRSPRERNVAGAHSNGFHVRLSAARQAALPDALRAGVSPPDTDVSTRSDALWGYKPGIEKALTLANELYSGAIRMDYPYRDLRLLRLFASFPADIFDLAPFDRAAARYILDGRVPDAIRLRRSGLPASPDHFTRLQLQAPAARTRIAAFRHAQVHDWLDLDWLDGALADMAARGTKSVAHANEVQLTAIAAEFFTWWRSRS